MPRIAPLPPEALPPDLREVLEFARGTMGFTPNDVLIMARWPELLQAMAGVVRVAFAPGRVAMELKRMVALMCSVAGGCRYCTAHNVHGLARDGMDPDRLAALWDFETSAAFSAAERAALRYARAAGSVPPEVDQQDFAALREHFDEAQILELAAVVSLFGFLNRWNASLATPLEDEPLAVARRTLGPHGWAPGAHREPGQA